MRVMNVGGDENRNGYLITNTPKVKENTKEWELTSNKNT